MHAHTTTARTHAARIRKDTPWKTKVSNDHFDDAAMQHTPHERKVTARTHYRTTAIGLRASSKHKQIAQQVKLQQKSKKSKVDRGRSIILQTATHSLSGMHTLSSMVVWYCVDLSCMCYCRRIVTMLILFFLLFLLFFIINTLSLLLSVHST
jgi:hypothetical protein